MTPSDAKMFTLYDAGTALGFTHKHRAKTVARLAKKGLRLTRYGHSTVRVSELDIIKFKADCAAVEKILKRSK